jgi:fumarate reductase flavoprotein subunit
MGAKLMNIQRFYGNLMHRDVFDNDRLWPYPSLDELRLHGAVVVDPKGQRFADEGRSASVLVNGVGQSSDPAGATVIMDAGMWDVAKARKTREPTFTPHQRPEPTTPEHGGADSLDPS